MVIVLAYLLGSIPFGYLIVSLTGRGDVRETGSGGTGATNVTRRAGRWAGVLTLVLDALKGSAAVLLARALVGSGGEAEWWVAFAGFAALAGHCFPVWLGFRGGKGVATGLGVFLVLAPAALLCSAPVFLAAVLLTRYVSLGSILAAAALALSVWLLAGHAYAPERRAPLTAAAAACAALIIAMHRANIRRLLSGTESRFR